MAVKDSKYNEKGSDSDVVVTTTETNYYDPMQESKWTRMGLTKESFKRAPGATRGHVVSGDAGDREKAGADPMLQQNMKNRHLQMIAVGGSIGTGLFIGSGSALRRGGPAGILIAWIIMGIMLLSTCQAIGEMAIMYPVSGGFYTLVGRFIDPSWAFAMGWNYVLQWAVVLPLELTAAAFTVQYWDPNGTVSIAVWISCFIIVMCAINVFTLGFAEEEFWSSVLKLTVIIIFLISALIFVLGGGPSNGSFNTYHGAQYWRNPGAFANGFKGVCAVFVTAAFSFAGTELVGLAATEHPNPRKVMPSAIKMTFWRITLIFIMSLLFVGLLVPYDDPRLVGGSYDANTSPFVLAYRIAGVGVMPDIINATITISVLSIGMSCIYAGSRTLLALAEQGYAPKIFTFVDKSGRPTWAVLAIIAFFPIAYLNLLDVGTQIFDWLLALSGLSTIFTWLSINVAHIRFRRAWKVQGHSVDELPYRALGGVYGSYLAAIILVLVLIAQFYVAVAPLGGTESAGEAVESFFLAYLAFPILLIFFICGAVYKGRIMPLRAHEIDLVTGRKCYDTAEQLNAERAERKNKPFITRTFNMLFN